MLQLRLLVGWNVAALVVVSTLLTGCLSDVDSGEYELIVDAAAEIPSGQGSPEDRQPGDGVGDADTASRTKVDEGRPDNRVIQQPPNAAAQNAAALNNPNEPVVRDQGSQSVNPLDAATSDVPEVPISTEILTPNSGSADPKSGSEKAQPRVVKLLIPNKKFKTEGPDKDLRVSFDDFDLLKVLNMDPVTEDAPSRMPKWLKQLDGKRIRLRGFMYPPFEATGIRGFTLARDNDICCFGRNPLVYDLVDVFMRKGETTDYIQGRPFDVIGIFRVGDSIIPGLLYSMDDAIVVDR